MWKKMAHNSQNNTANPPSPTSHLRTIYLTTYNLLFAALWTSVFTTTISHLSKPRETLFAATKPLALTNQTASLLEILHAAFGTTLPLPSSLPFHFSMNEQPLTPKGLIKSPLSTTALQTTTRVIQVWMIWHCFPSSTASSHAYTALLLAWSVADSIRYVYLALNMHGRAPGWLAWVR